MGFKPTTAPDMSAAALRAPPQCKLLTFAGPAGDLSGQVDRSRQRDRQQHAGVIQVARDEQDQRDDQADADGRQPCDAIERHASVFCGTPMPPALTPALALEYVHELSADVRAAVVLDAAGALLAGPAALAAPARALLDAGAGAAELEDGSAEGVVC